MTNSVTIDFDGYPGSSHLDSGSGNTYIYGDGSVTITLDTSPVGLPGYKSLTHKPTNNSDTIGSIKYSEEIQTGFPPTLSQYPSVTVYCWGQDYRPLVVKLGNESIYYISEGKDYSSNKWNSTSTSFRGWNLLEILHRANCNKNKSHVINLSATSGPYNCPSCDEEQINVSPVQGSGYIWYGHTLSGKDSSISGFKYGNQYQVGFKKLEGYDRVNVYWYPPEGKVKSKPLLIHLSVTSGNLWYKRDKDPNNWTEVIEGEKPISPFGNNPKILELLQKISLTTINPRAVNHASQENSELSPSTPSSVTKSPGTILIVGFLSPGLPRGSLNILYSESKAVSDQPASTQDLEVLEDSATVNSSEDIFPEQILESFPKSAQEHLENLLNFKVNLESMVPGKRRKTAVEPQKTEAKSTKPARRTPFKLEYDTKTEPFRHVEEGECKIPNFANVWNAIVDMRQKKDAPVDTMGAHCLADSPDPATYEFQTLVACMLSSQTKDQVTAQTMDVLKKRGLTLDSIMEISEEELDTLISRVGFHNTKAKNIKKTATIIHEKFGGRVPDTMEELVSLPGVGPKMANLVIQLAFKRIDGISVDLHVHRISNRLGWVKTKTPDETRLQLQELIPQKLWAEVNHLLVGFGQTICTAAGPGCATCGANKWCPTGIANLKRGV
ncbi:endonuclease III family member protein [Theileria equi strain WA]|uniref:Endonuclease III homolog n=1 Tax=Theileria equi strain WA TaxID=1537102 RepID=L1LB25_THEEQ|nr:endonuclease III family member protein [Theileria equi strain WA]EKX72474.1 endonuclease III family member protein [Theileria equi strain WA]|eukprot:XP_004831926.1 endonuclease III family member protein [Theileria equi strain WA]